jgi:hypothetical protein
MLLYTSITDPPPATMGRAAFGAFVNYVRQAAVTFRPPRVCANLAFHSATRRGARAPFYDILLDIRRWRPYRDHRLSSQREEQKNLAQVRRRDFGSSTRLLASVNSGDYPLAMNSLAEIESAVQRLALSDQEMLLHHLETLVETRRNSLCVESRQEWVKRLGAVRAQISTGRQTLSSEEILDELREERC